MTTRTIVSAAIALHILALSGLAQTEKAGAGVAAKSSKAVKASLSKAAVSPAEAARPEEDNPHLWKPKVTSVAVFKNGLGFFLRQGEVQLRDGWCMAREVPPATFGTLALFAHDDKLMVDVVGSGPGELVAFDGADAPKDAEAKLARLEACNGLNVQLTYKQQSAERSAAGKVRGVGPKFIILENEGGNSAVAVEDIVSLRVLELPVRVHVTGDGGQPPDRATLGMAYLRKGITWIPEYTLTVLNDDEAELTLRGTLVNEAEDLVHCDVQFVVGVPHFVHTEYLAPLAFGQMIRTIGSAVAPAQVQSQIMQRAAIVSNSARAMDVVEQPAGGPARDAALLGNLPQMDAGGAATDYTVYAKKDLTVRCGEKAIVTLFRKKIKYSHIYRWFPPSAMEHFLVLHNATDTAWTTGPCLAVSQGSPLSEDLLKYVPKGGSGELTVTAAINVAQERTEREKDRKFKAHSPADKVFLDLVTLEGELQVKNFEKRPITIVITLPVPGRPLEASDDGTKAAGVTNLKLLELSGTIHWKLELQPGQKKTLTYVYERYVPSN